MPSFFSIGDTPSMMSESYPELGCLHIIGRNRGLLTPEIATVRKEIRPAISTFCRIGYAELGTRQKKQPPRPAISGTRGLFGNNFSKKRLDYCFENVIWSIKILPVFGLELISSKTKTSSFKEFQFSIRRNFSNGIEIFCHWSVTPLTI